MMKRPTITTIIDTYNYGGYLDHAIDSVLTQTLPEEEREVLVVDDGSTDDTPLRMVRYGDRVRYIRKSNGGQASAFNLGVKEACGEIVAFLDADDWFYPSKLAEVAEKFSREPETGVVYNRYDAVDEAGILIQANNPKYLYAGDLSGRTLLGFVSGSPSSGISVRKKLIERIVIPEEPFRISADHFYLNILPLITKVGVLETSLHSYRVHGANLYLGKSNMGRKEILARQKEEIWKYAREVLGREFFRAMDELEANENGDWDRRLPYMYRSGIRHIQGAQVEISLKLWIFLKLTTHAVLPREIFNFLRDIRNRLSKNRVRF